MIQTVYRQLAQLYPGPVTVSEPLQQAVTFLRWEIAAETVVRGGYGAGIGLGVVALFAVGVLPIPASAPVVLICATMALLCVHLAHQAPVWTAQLHRTAALGAAPALIGRAVLRMRIDPSEESAVAFAAEAGDDRLAESLAEHISRATGEPGSGLRSFGEEWQDWFPALSRAIQLLGTAGTAPPAKRERALDRALAAVLDGTSDQLRSFTSSITGPATGIYAFGVLLPLALVAVLPGAQTAGVDVTLPMIVLIYNVLLPAGLLVACGWILLRRPVAFPPPSIPRSHPDLPAHRWAGPLTGCVIGGAVAGAGWLIVGPWIAPILGVGIAVGVGLLCWYRPVMEIRNEVQDIEAGLPDALYLVGRRVDDGHAIEQGIADTARDLSGPIGDLFADAVRRQRVLAIGIREALLGDHGALTDVPSQRTHNLASLLSLSGQEGQPAGHAIVAMADHLDDLQRVEREAAHELRQVTSTLSNTAGIFGPLVAGATVALADGMHAMEASDEVATVATGELGLAVGTYVLVLSAVLVVLSVALRHGLDRPAIGYHVGITMTTATVVFAGAYLLAGTLF